MRFVRLLLCASLSFLLIISAGARTPRQNPPKITVVVPFDFMVERTMFPAGEYVISKNGDGFRLQAEHGIESVVFTGRPSRTPSYAHAPSLNFAKVNEHLQLRQLWISSTLGLDLSRETKPQVLDVHTWHIEVQGECLSCE